MKRNLRLLLLITLLVASAGVGTVGVHASTDCQQIFRAYQAQLAKRLHHKVSAETLARWAAWNKAHPNYHPTKRESLDKVDFVCGLPTGASGLGQDLPPVGLPPIVSVLGEAFSAPIEPTILVSKLLAPDTPLNSPVADPLYPPVYYPAVNGMTPAISATPEPASLVLMATALALIVLRGRRWAWRGGMKG